MEKAILDKALWLKRFEQNNLNSFLLNKIPRANSQIAMLS
jgi:hypothetical protein